MRVVGLHPDPLVSRLLHKWGASAGQCESEVAQRLFRNLDELREFFRLTFPRSAPVDATGTDGRLPWSDFEGMGESISPLNVLKVLGDIGADRTALAPASYLAHFAEWTRASGGGEWLWGSKDGAIIVRFLDAFKGESPADLRSVFYAVQWRDIEKAKWFLSTMHLGVPGDFLASVVIWSELEAWQDWRPEVIVDGYRAGMSVEYFRHFWTQPRVFEELQRGGIPFEYAIALGGNEGSGTETALV